MGLSDHAAFVHDWCNRDYYAILLGAIEKAAQDRGMTIGPAAGPAFSEDDFGAIAETLVAVRRLYLGPDTPPEVLMQQVAYDMSDGYAHMWLRSILSALEEKGLYLHRSLR